MAKKKPTEPPPGPPEIPAQRAIELLQAQVAKGEALLVAGQLSSDDHNAWKLLTENLLAKAFGRGSPNVAAVTDVGEYGSFPMNANEAWWAQHRANSLTTQLSSLHALIELLQTQAQLDSPSHAIAAAAVHGHSIFLVHGRDERYIHEVARFLEKLQQEVLVLREQPNGGRTIIEKFEDYANVGFAVVLLTPDDRGALADAAAELRPRARQNVIFELGYFIGRLSRARVCALYAAGVEIPSDYSGVLFVPLDDAGMWRMQLAKELKAAGFEVDMNLAM
jgi:predicted nucleotide-binding protein